MTWAERGLRYATVLCAGWTVVAALVGPVLDIGETTLARFNLAERLIIYGYLSSLRGAIPFLLLTVGVAPTVVSLLWLVRRERPPALGSLANERMHLSGWLLWIGIVATMALLAAGVSHIHPGAMPMGFILWAVMTMFWAYAGALHRAFRVQSLREATESTKVNSTYLALAGLVPWLLGAGLLIPLWVFWASRSTPMRLPK